MSFVLPFHPRETNTFLNFQFMALFFLQNVLMKACYLKLDSRVISPITPFLLVVHP